MRATVIHGPGDIRLETVPDPVITKPTDAIVEVVAGCICGSDLWGYRGENPPSDPHTIGHECVGVIVAVGEAVANFSVGDWVIVPFCHSDNTCVHCQAGMTSACVESAFTQSGQGEFALVTHADGSLVKTPGVPDPALIPSLLTLSDVMATGWHAAFSSGVRPGGTAVVFGDGAVGLCAVLSARVMGAEKIVALSRHEPRQEIARAFGATHVVAERGKAATAAVMEITGGVGADAVMECVGTKDAITTAFAAARPGSTVGFVGVPHGVELPVASMFYRNIGLGGGLANVRRYLPELLDLVLSGAINPGLVFDSTMGLTDVAAGYVAMDERAAIKVLLDPTR